MAIHVLPTETTQTDGKPKIKTEKTLVETLWGVNKISTIRQLRPLKIKKQTNFHTIHLSENGKTKNQHIWY